MNIAKHLRNLSLFAPAIFLITLLYTVPTAYCFQDDDVITKYLSKMDRITDVFEKDYDANEFVLVGDVKKFSNGATKNEHLSGETTGIKLELVTATSLLPSQIPSSDYTCTYFTKLIAAGDELDTLCDETVNTCDYFKCYVVDEYKDDTIKVTAFKEYIEQEDVGDMDLDGDGSPDGIVEVYVTSYTRPSNEIELRCSNFNNCTSQVAKDVNGNDDPESNSNDSMLGPTELPTGAPNNSGNPFASDRSGAGGGNCSLVGSSTINYTSILIFLFGFLFIGVKRYKSSN